jgi:AraC-like DNA-binding protein
MTRKHTFPVDSGWRTLLKDLGIRADHLLRKAGLPGDLFSRPESGLTTEEYFHFWRTLETEVADPLFPLRMVETITTESFVPPIFAALCSSNLLQASQRLEKYKELIAPMRLEITLGERGELLLTPHWLNALGKVPFSVVVAELAFFVKLARLATRSPVPALRVMMPHLPASGETAAYAEFFGVRISRGDDPRVSFSGTDATRPFLTANEAMWNVFEPDLRRRLSELEDTATMGERVAALLLELLPSGEASIEAVASRLAMSKRTLQRRLDEENETFRTLVNGTRERLARHYLTQTNLSSGEIAFLLGFDDPNSFFRAFQEWTGQTPETIRYAMT